MRAIRCSSVVLCFAAGLGAQSFHDDFLQQLDEIQTKTLALARDIPAERYTWRPGPGVRSVSEVLLHVASSNFVNAMFLGVPVPADVPLGRDPARWETATTDHEKVVSWLSLSFEQVRTAAAKNADADLERMVKMPGQAARLRTQLFRYCAHAHEHLGQLIAYARSNGVAPPW